MITQGSVCTQPSSTPPPHTHTHTHSLTHTHTHTHSLTHTHTHAHSLSLTHTLTHSHTLTLTHRIVEQRDELQSKLEMLEQVVSSAYHQIPEVSPWHKE